MSYAPTWCYYGVYTRKALPGWYYPLFGYSHRRNLVEKRSYMLTTAVLTRLYVGVYRHNV